MSGQTPAGWYDQPDGSQQYWDGQRWVESPSSPEGEATSSPQPLKGSDKYSRDLSAQPQLWSEANGYVLTMDGWQPEALVTAQRAQAAKIGDQSGIWAVLGLVICLPLSIVALVQWNRARRMQAAWGGQRTAVWPAWVAGISLGVWLVLIAFFVLPALSTSQSTYGGGTNTDSLTAEVSAGPLETDQFGSAFTTVTITSPADAPSTCTYVATVTADSPDGSRQYSTAIASAESLKPGQTATSEAVFFDEVPADAIISVEPPGCIPG